MQKPPAAVVILSRLLHNSFQDRHHTIHRRSISNRQPTQEIVMLLKTLAGALLIAASAAAPAAQKYTIDKNHTYITFTYNHFGFSNPVLKLEKIDGDLELDTADLTRSRVSVTLPLDGLHSGVDKLDSDLKAPGFFDAAQFPDITFKSTKVEKSGDALKITGDLTVHGVTKPVV